MLSRIIQAVATVAIFFVLVVCHAASVSLALAHDSWISREQYRSSSSGSWCCDEHDWFPIDDYQIMKTVSGFLVVGIYLVAYEHAVPSSDDRYWVCFNKEGTGAHYRPKAIVGELGCSTDIGSSTPMARSSRMSASESVNRQRDGASPGCYSSTR